MDPEFLLVLTLTGGREGCAGTGTDRKAALPSPADRAAANGFANNRRPIGDRIITTIRGLWGIAALRVRKTTAPEG